MKSLLLIVLSFVTCITCQSDALIKRDLSSETVAQTRIIGGSTVSISRYSYAVSFQDVNGHFCGGALIAKDVVLTAAHCLGGDFKVIINRNNIYDDTIGDSIDVKQAIPHPEYNSRTTEYDIALVFLTRPTAEEVKLAKVNFRPSVPRIGQSLTVMGWGDMIAADDEIELSETLQAVQVKVISNADCESRSGRINGQWDSYKNQINGTMICASDTDRDACTGDSGGPLIVRRKNGNHIVVGTVSWGIGCASEVFPGVYARVSVVHGWIKSEVCSGSVEPPFSLCRFGSNGSNGTINKSWTKLMSEDFVSGYGNFKFGGSNIAYYNSMHERSGVIRIQAANGMRSSFYSKQLVLDDKYYRKFKVIFSFYANSIESNHRFCLDFSTNGGTIWKKAKCWSSNSEFNKLQWYDGETATLRPSNKVGSFKIRFRCDGRNGGTDVLIDKVEVKGVQV